MNNGGIDAAGLVVVGIDAAGLVVVGIDGADAIFK
jgi:hypothetical protein